MKAKDETNHESWTYKFLLIIHSGTFYEVIWDVIHDQFNTISLKNPTSKLYHYWAKK